MNGLSGHQLFRFGRQTFGQFCLGAEDLLTDRLIGGPTGKFHLIQNQSNRIMTLKYAQVLFPFLMKITFIKLVFGEHFLCRINGNGVFLS